MVEIPGGPVTLGLSSSSGTFGWDNEFEAHTVEVPAFAIDKYKVTNGQYLEFMEAGGYENRDLWSDADWQWKAAQNITHPAFWRRSARWLALSRHVRRDSAAARRARLCEPRRSERLCALGRQEVANGGAMAARGDRSCSRVATLIFNIGILRP